MRKLIVALVLVLVCSSISVADEMYGEHTIHGMNYDKHAVEQLLDDSEVPAEVTADERGVGKLKGKFKLDKSMKVEDAAVDFIDKHRNAFKLKDPKKELKLNEKRVHKECDTHIYYQQTYNDVPIWQSMATVHMDKNNNIDRISSGNIPTPDIDTTPLVTKEEAVEIASRDRQSVQHGGISKIITKLVLYNEYKGPKLAYFVTFLQNFHSWIYFIDAKTGEIIEKFSNDTYDGSVDATGVIRITNNPNTTTTATFGM